MIYDKCASINSNGDVVNLFITIMHTKLKNNVGKKSINKSFYGYFFCSVNALMSLFNKCTFFFGLILHDALTMVVGF